MPPTNPLSDGPDVPPDIPAEYVDAYLAGFQRGYEGEVEPVVSEPADVAPEREPAGLDKLDRQTHATDRRTDVTDRPTDDSDQPGVDLNPPTDELEAPTVVVEERGLDKLDRPTEVDQRGLDELDRPGVKPERNRPNTDRPEDMEWLFERDRDAPLGWAFNPANESISDQSGGSRVGAGSTRTATEASAGEASGRTARSPWVVLIGFLAILVVLMLVAYIGGMAFSTIVDR